jgi:hypothetical protein
MPSQLTTVEMASTRIELRYWQVPSILGGTEYVALPKVWPGLAQIFGRKNYEFHFVELVIERGWL